MLTTYPDFLGKIPPTSDLCLSEGVCLVGPQCWHSCPRVRAGQGRLLSVLGQVMDAQLSVHFAESMVDLQR